MSFDCVLVYTTGAGPRKWEGLPEPVLGHEVLHECGGGGCREEQHAQRCREKQEGNEGIEERVQCTEERYYQERSSERKGRGSTDSFGQIPRWCWSRGDGHRCRAFTSEGGNKRL